MKQQGIIICNW